MSEPTRPNDEPAASTHSRRASRTGDAIPARASALEPLATASLTHPVVGPTLSFPRTMSQSKYIVAGKGAVWCALRSRRSFSWLWG